MTATPDNDDHVSPAAADLLHAGGEAAHRVLARTKDGLDQARGTVADAYASSRDRATDAYATAREKVRAAGHSATETLDSNPVAVLLGGLVIGAVIGALLPRTGQESKALGAVGEKLHGAAREAADAAREAGRSKLAEFGISRDQARETIKSLFDGLIAAAGTAGTAALDRAQKARSEAGDTADKDQKTA
jgi:ElaB/YqjD/DUF883 family membrane-anchored ribosome-binding protein